MSKLTIDLIKTCENYHVAIEKGFKVFLVEEADCILIALQRGDVVSTTNTLFKEFDSEKMVNHFIHLQMATINGMQLKEIKSWPIKYSVDDLKSIDFKSHFNYLDDQVDQMLRDAGIEPNE